MQVELPLSLEQRNMLNRYNKEHANTKYKKLFEMSGNAVLNYIMARDLQVRSRIWLGDNVSRPFCVIARTGIWSVLYFYRFKIELKYENLMIFISNLLSTEINEAQHGSRRNQKGQQIRAAALHLIESGTRFASQVITLVLSSVNLVLKSTKSLFSGNWLRDIPDLFTNVLENATSSNLLEVSWTVPIMFKLTLKNIFMGLTFIEGFLTGPIAASLEWISFKGVVRISPANMRLLDKYYPGTDTHTLPSVKDKIWFIWRQSDLELLIKAARNKETEAAPQISSVKPKKIDDRLEEADDVVKQASPRTRRRRAHTPAPNRKRCSGTTRKGEQCKFKCKDGTDYCSRHQGQGSSNRAQFGKKNNFLG